VTEIYSLTKNFPSSERFGLINQINRSAVSIPSNIAEGAGRDSNNEFVQFLTIANASAYELETQLIIAKNLGFISEQVLNEITDRIDKIQKMIFKLKISVRKK
jgi:four helix bundle protein